MKILLVFGTRPEAIKMCPLALELRKRNNIECKICLTGQHREMLKQVMEAFNIHEDYNLDIMKKNQSLTSITTDVMTLLEPILKKELPDIVLVHGDTTTSYAAALASFYQKIPVGHVEAGLRTGDIYSPYPEEMNRLLTDRISTVFFAPTELNKSNLEMEGRKENVYVTGNTVIDSFQYTVRNNYVFNFAVLNTISFEQKKCILLTAHRRENLGTPLESICQVVKKIATENTDVLFIYPVHLNPMVMEPVHRILDGIDNVLLIPPLDVLDMHNLMARCYMVMTDSGGIQEEAPHFGKPVLVLRTETERPEAVLAGTVKIVGTDIDSIYDETILILSSKDAYEKMACSVNPYGDGHASERIADILNSIYV